MASAPDTRAAAAVKVFRQLQPTLNSFARTFTGNSRIRVEPHSKLTGTDGNKIYYRVPMSLADMGAHERSQCGKRDAHGHQICHACDQRELVMVTIYHEISHVVSGSVAPLKESTRVDLITSTIPRLPEVVRKRVHSAMLRATYDERTSYAHVASIVSPWLQFLVNAIEDARVDAAMYEARPGTLAMKLSQMSYIRDEGVEQEHTDDGPIVKFWYDYPENSQVCLGTYFMASGLSPDGWFSDKINEALEDERLRSIVGSVPHASAEEVYLVSVDTLVRLWEMGYCDPPIEESDDEQGKDEDSDDNEDTEESGKDSDVGQQEGSGSGSDDGSPEDGDDPSDAGGGGQGGGDGEDEQREDSEEGGAVPSDDEERDTEDSDDSAGEERSQGTVAEAAQHFDESSNHHDTYTGPQEVDLTLEDDESGSPVGVASGEASTEDMSAEEAALAAAILVGSYFESESHGVKLVREHYYDTRDATAIAWDNSSMWAKISAQNSGDLDIMPPETALGPALLRMRAAFADNQRWQYQRNLKSGRIAGRVLGKRAIHNDPRLFQAKRMPGKRSYFVMIAMDVSGSTANGNIEIEKRAVMAQAELLHRSGIPFTLVAHSADYADDNNAYDGGFSLELYHIKDEAEPWDTRTRQRLENISPHAGNLDGHMLEYMRRAADTSSATDKVLLYYSDGKFPATNADEEREVLDRELKTVKQRGYTLLGVGIRTDSPTKVGMDTVEVWDDAGIAKVVAALEERLVRR